MAPAVTRLTRTRGVGPRQWTGAVMRWMVADDTGLAASPVAARFSPLLARALWSRQARTLDACAALLSDYRAPFRAWGGLPDMAVAVERLAAAARAGQPVAIFGDYDADGMAATAMAALTLTALGVPVCTRLPDRLHEGYGLNAAAVREMAAWLHAHQEGGRPLLMTVDCGVTNRAEIDLANELGLDVLVFDHHTVLPPLPRALALVDPKREEASTGAHALTAAGLMLHLARGLFEAGPALVDAADPEVLKRDLLALAAIGTLADVAPISGENRTIVARGLRALRQEPRPGLVALMEVSGVARAAVDAEAISWRLAPRLNAAGRMRHPELGLRLLLTGDPAEARRLAVTLDELNQRRQAELERILGEARRLPGAFDHPVPVLAGDGWSPGLVGLVAGRLAEELGRPVIVLGNEGALARGSARSREGFDITAALSGCAHLLTRFGGHGQAAGLTIERAQVPALQAALNDQAAHAWPGGLPEPNLALSGRATLADFEPAALRDLQRLAPFGHGNEEPRWLIERVRVIEARPVGARGQHLRFRIGDGQRTLSGIAFRQGERAEAMRAAGHVDVAGAARLDIWQGQQRVDMQAADFRPAH
jgi:single-stranded-DNA-specific exonuclease